MKNFAKLIKQLELSSLTQYKQYTPLYIKEALNCGNWNEWDEDVFNDYFEKSHNSVAYVGQGFFRSHHKERIKNNWMRLAPHLKAIASSQDVPLWDEYKTIRKIIKECTKDNMQIATNRLIACLQPKLLCTEVDLRKINELFDFIQTYTDAPIPQYDRDNWEKASYALLRMMHEADPERDYMNFAYIPWKLLDYFKTSLIKGSLPTYWLTSWNENNFMLHKYFSQYDIIDWNNTNNNHFNIGDIVFLYCSSPERKIRYKTQVIKLNIAPEEEIDDHVFSLNTSPSKPSQYRPIRLKKMAEIDTESLNYENLHARGLKGAIRTPRTLKGELWQYINSFWEKDEDIYDDIKNPEDIYEGAKKTIVVNSYERNQDARNACIAAHGYNCSACGMDFEKMYGELGRGFILYSQPASASCLQS